MKKILLYTLFVLLTLSSAFSQKQDSLFNLLNNTKNDSLKAMILYELAVIEKNVDSSFNYLYNGLKIVQNSDNYNGIAKILHLMGNKKFALNELDSALSYWHKSEKFYRKYYVERGFNIHEKMGSTYYTLAFGYYHKGNFIKTIEYAQMAAKSYLKNEQNHKVLSCYNILGIVHMAEDEYDEAEKYFSKVLKLAITFQDTTTISKMYNNLAALYTNTQKFQKALDYYQKNLSIRKVSIDEDLPIKMNVGTVLRHLGKYEEARKILTSGVYKLAKTNDVRGRITSLNVLGDFYLEVHEWKNLLGVSMRSMKLLEELPILEQKKFATFNLSEAYKNLGDTKMAFKYYRLHVTLKDSIFNVEKSNQIEKLEAQFEFEKKENEISQLTEANLLNEIQIAEDRNVKIGLLGAFVFFTMVGLILFINYKRRQERSRQEIALKKMEIEQRMLRSQMNPHFIFNALNSIQSYIATNDTYQAEIFLSKFSTLIRNILEISLNEYINFDKEIETLRLYMELEKLRFNDKFDFKIDDQLTDSTFKVPPMLIQPFVENAIIHGMKGKTDKGKIEVQFSELDDELILCSIDDDGVGRNLNTTQKDHQSLATKLTDERIHFFNQKNSHQFDIKIFDKKDEENNAIGTRVELLIPII